MAIVKFRKTPNHPRERAGKLDFPTTVLAISTLAFGVTFYAMTPSAPGRDQIADYVEVRTTDQSYRDCAAARAAGRSNIPAWDPSYRERMDGDGDGLACEPHFRR